VSNASRPASFGPTVAPKYDTAPITVSYIRGGEIEVQTFNIIVKPIDMGTAFRLMLAGAVNDATALPSMIRLIGQYMVNHDGVSATWEYKPLAPKPDEPEISRFRAPNGKFLPVEKAEQFTDPAKGSSRRRWLHLMNVDEDAEIQQETITDLLKYLTEVAANRPTPASS
jgi:hypothetical protein